MRRSWKSALPALMGLSALVALGACEPAPPPPPPVPPAPVFPQDKIDACTAEFAGGLDKAPDTIQTHGTFTDAQGRAMLRMETADGNHEANCQLTADGSTLILPAS